MSLRHLLFAAGFTCVGAVVGWVATPLVWVPWMALRRGLRRLARRPA